MVLQDAKTAKAALLVDHFGEGAKDGLLELALHLSSPLVSTMLVHQEVFRKEAGQTSETYLKVWKTKHRHLSTVASIKRWWGRCDEPVSGPWPLIMRDDYSGVRLKSLGKDKGKNQESQHRYAYRHATA